MNKQAVFRIFLTTIVTSILTMQNLSATDVAEGESLFTTHCTACHHLEMRLVGPPLKNVTQRRDTTWLLRFIRSSQSMIQAGDSTAVALFNTYNKVQMPDQDLTPDQIRSILAFLGQSGGAATAEDNRIPRPAQAQASDIKPLKFTDYRFWMLYTVTVILVIVSINYKAEMVALNKRVDAEEADRMRQIP